jgi:hypothetical protein
VGNDDRGDRSEQPRSLTTLSPVEPDRLGELRRRLLFVANVPGVSRPLLELATVQYARWIVFSELPAPDGSGERWRLNWSYLLFDATYDGSKLQYVRAFADVLPLRLSRLFGTCFGFQYMVEQAPGSGGRVIPARAFEGFLDSNTLKVEKHHFWWARPDSAEAKRQAMAIERATQRCDRRRGRTLSRTQHEIEGLALGPPATRPTLREATLAPLRRHLRPASAVNPLVIAAPLQDDGWRGVARYTLSGLPKTHFARLARIPSTMQQHLGHPHPDRLERDYLLFSCDHDGTLDSYVTALSEQPGSLRNQLSWCVDFPGVDDPYALREWIDAHRLKVQYFLAGVPPRPVKEVGELVRERKLIARVTLDGTAALADPDR